jgi:hypothetical protein
MLRQRLEYHSIGRAPVFPDRANGNGQSVFTLHPSAARSVRRSEKQEFCATLKRSAASLGVFHQELGGMVTPLFVWPYATPN